MSTLGAAQIGPEINSEWKSVQVPRFLIKYFYYQSFKRKLSGYKFSFSLRLSAVQRVEEKVPAGARPAPDPQFGVIA
jgi:hypothetical protein